MNALYESGITAHRERKNDLRSAEFKISGNAGHVYKNRVVHHGTLLVNANLERLKECLRVKQGVYIDKAVQSIRSAVINLRDINPSVSIARLTKKIVKSVDGVIVELEIGFNEAVNSLVQAKFRTWEWNFAYSPYYTFVSTDEHAEYFRLRVEKGIIISAEAINDKYAWAEKLIGIKHNYNNIQEFLLNKDIAPALVWKCF